MVVLSTKLGAIHQIDDPFLPAACQQIAIPVGKPHRAGTADIPIVLVHLAPIQWCEVVFQLQVMERCSNDTAPVLLVSWIKVTVAGHAKNSTVPANHESAPPPDASPAPFRDEQHPNQGTKRVA